MPEQRTTAEGRRARRRGAVRLAVATAVAALPMTAVLAAGSAAPPAPPLGPCGGPDCPGAWPPVHNGDFSGRDATISVFTGGDLTVKGRAAEAEGKIVVLGRVTVDKDLSAGPGGAYAMAVVGVGSRVVPPDGTDFVTVGGPVDVRSGNTLYVGGRDSRGTAYGNLRHGGTLTGAADIAPSGLAIRDDGAAAPFRSVLTRIEELSACVGRAPATGTVTVTDRDATFTGDGIGMRQVFEVTGNLGEAGRQIGLNFDGIPAGATVVVNMLADDPVISTYTGTGLPGDPTTELRPRLLWNFPTATTARILGGAQFQGSVLAGNAAGTTTVAVPGLNGRVHLAGSLIHTGGGGYEIHNYPFDGELPECEAGPSPSPTSSVPPTSPVPPPEPTASPVDSGAVRPTAGPTRSPGGGPIRQRPVGRPPAAGHVDGGGEPSSGGSVVADRESVGVGKSVLRWV
ncbi:choice-of-anchor A family protein [Kitasatospora sp. NPDC004240]